MGKDWLLAGVLTLLAGSQAIADQSFASFGSAAPPLSPGELGDGRSVSAIDGVLWGAFLSHHNYDLSGDPSYTFTFDFNGPVLPSNDPKIVLFLGQSAITSGSILITGAQWVDRVGGGTATLGTLPLTGYDITLSTYATPNFPAGTGRFILPNSGLYTSYTTSPGFDFGYFDRLVLTIQFAAAGGPNVDDAFLQFDAVANPEPGTMALFGLGALGLGGLAWRRRRARRSASK
jgi:hypothetical protein